MNSLGKILLYFIGVVILGSLLAPPMYWGVQSLKPWAESHGYLKYKEKTRDDGSIERKPKGTLGFLDSRFGKVSNRAMLVAAVLLLWPTFRSLRIGNAGALGLRPNPARYQQLFLGYAVSLLIMGIFGCGLLYFTVYDLKVPIPWGDVGLVVVSSLIVAALEEWVFRGAFLGLFKQTMSQWMALGAVSAIYSLVHFLKSPESAIGGAEVHWGSGFLLLGELFHDFSDPLLFLGKFSTLFLLGLILGYCVMRTQSLWLGIGIHAGVVIGKYGFIKAADRNKEMRDLLPWIGEDMAVGVIPLVLMAVIGILVWMCLPYVLARPSKSIGLDGPRES